MPYLSISKFAKLIGVTPQCLRNWDKSGLLKPHHTTESGFRYYIQEQANAFLNIQTRTIATPITVGYCRVSSNKQKDVGSRLV